MVCGNVHPPEGLVKGTVETAFREQGYPASLPGDIQVLQAPG